MFQIGSYVIYGTQGVCHIEDRRQENLTGDAREYYILSVVSDPKTVIYVPTDSPALVARMRPLLSRDEVTDLIHTASTDDLLEWDRDPRARSRMFEDILQSGDRRRLFCMLRTIHSQREAQAALRKKLYAADEMAAHRAEQLLHGELGFVLHILPTEVQDYIASELEKSS